MESNFIIINSIRYKTTQHSKKIESIPKLRADHVKLSFMIVGYI